jgi:hypothetical protein
MKPLTETQHYVGKVMRLTDRCDANPDGRVCACCNLSIQNCLCEHDNRVDDTACIRRH